MNTIISTTNRKNSNTYDVARYYQKNLQGKGMDIKLLSLTDLPDNLIVSDLYGNRSEAFQRIQDLILQTQKFIFIIPEYNGSFPGILKTFIDCCKFPESFRDKKATLVGISTGRYGNVRGLEHFTGICHYIGLEVMPFRIHIPHINSELNEEKVFFKEATMRFLNQQMERFIRF